MELRVVRLNDMKPYQNNPRINDNAVEPVKESLKQVGYVTPIVLDENYEILAGHTRYRALMEQGVESVECIIQSGMTEEQKKKYRILDNKTGELAEWDEELLKGELKNLDLGGIDWFDDLLNPNLKLEGSVKMDETPAAEKDEIVRCPRCGTVVGNEPEYDDSADEEYPF